MRSLAPMILSALVLAGCSSEPASEPDPCAVVPCLTTAPPVTTAPRPAGPTPLPHYPSDGTSEMTTGFVAGADGHRVPITVYRPLVANTTQQVPVLLHSHGFAGSRATEDDAFRSQVAAGFGVVSIDMRGHGEARDTSQIRVHHMDYEIADVLAVIDHVATLDWVMLDAPGDPRLGAIGGSYGGGYQLLTAAVDPRLDAIVPEITWNDLVESLAPHGAIKSAWVDLLYAAGNSQGNFHESIHEAYAWAMATNTLPDGSEPGEPDIVAQFKGSSPVAYAGAITIPTLLVQGMPDTLFNFNQAAANYAQIKATGAPVRLVTHLNGHILNTDGTIPVPSPEPVGLQPPRGPDPCGDPDAMAIEWFLQHLLFQPVPVEPEVCVALDSGQVLLAPSFPVGEPFDVSVGEVLVPHLPGQRAEAVVFTAEAETVVAGIPRLSGTVTSPGPDAIVYWSLEKRSGDVAVTVDSQVTPFRTAAAEATPFATDLMGIATHLQPGDELVLVAAATDPQFLHNTGRLPGLVTFDDIDLLLPLVPFVVP